jgi:hypothetical protein
MLDSWEALKLLVQQFDQDEPLLQGHAVGLSGRVKA